MRRVLIIIGRFGAAGILSLTLAYLIIGVLISFMVLTPPRLWLGSSYIGLLPLQAALRRADYIKPSPPRLVFSYQDKMATIDPDEIGLDISYTQPLSDYLGWLGGQNYKDRWSQYHRLVINDLRLKPSINLELSLLTKKLDRIFDNYWLSPQPAKLTFDGRLKIIPAVDGQIIDQGHLKNQIKRFLTEDKSRPIIIKLKDVSLTPTKKQINQAYQAGDWIIKTPIILTRGSKQVKLTPTEKVSLISVYGGLDQERLTELIKEKAEQFNQPPQDALFKYVNGRVTVFRPSQDGFRVNNQTLQNKLQEALASLVNSDQPPQQIKIEVPGRVVKPDITTQNSNTYGIKELVGQGESWFAHSIANRVHNITLAADRINGVLVSPGEVFSFNQYLGEVSARTGYRSSYVIKQGKTILDDGGGVCQVSTTLFRAVLNAGLPIIERRAHSYRVSYYEQKSPVGFDATVFAPYVDFKFKNDLDSYLLIQAEVDVKTKHLVFKLYGTKDGRQVKISKVRIWDQSPPPEPIYQPDPSLPVGTTKQIEWPAWGAKAAFDWTVTKNGQILYQKTFFSSYKPWAAVYLTNHP